MIRIFQLLITLYLAAVLYSCGENIDVEDKTAPTKPVFHGKSSDSAMVESGIDAVSEGDYIYLEWKPNQESDLQGYIIERKDPDSTQWIQLGSMLAKGDTTYLDNSDGLIDDNNTNKKFFYRVLAVDESGNRSEPSFEESYRLLPKVNISDFVKLDDNYLKVECSYQGDYNSIYFNFRFYENNRIVHVYERDTLIQDNQNTFYFDNRNFNFDLSALTLRVDAKYSIRKGSESYLKQLSVNSNDNK